MTNTDAERYIYEVLGLSEVEQSIMEIASGIAKSASTIAYHSKVPVTSMPYKLRKLEKRHLVTRIGNGHKQVRWRSNMLKVLRAFRAEYPKFIERLHRPR